MTFDVFMGKVDDACWAKYGMSIHDLTDFDFYADFMFGVKPATVAKKAAKAAGGF